MAANFIVSKKHKKITLFSNCNFFSIRLVGMCEKNCQVMGSLI